MPRVMNTSIALDRSSTTSPFQRTAHATCPLCEGTEFMEIRTEDATKHSLYQSNLPQTVAWIGCDRCGHLFTEGYFEKEALQTLLSKASTSPLSAHEVEERRAHAAKIVDRVSQIRGSIEGRWLDVGTGRGALMTTAAEFGYDAIGVDLLAERTEPLVEMGYDARTIAFEDFEDATGFDVISLDGTLAHMPFPRRILAHALKMMRPGGVIFFSMPNVDTHAWKRMDAEAQNPHWTDLEHCHNFSRGHLYWLLGQMGFQPCHYMASTETPAGMEVCAWRSEDLDSQG